MSYRDGYLTDISGKRYGMLTVLAFSHVQPQKKPTTRKGVGNRFWKVKCDCGTVKTVSYAKLTRFESPLRSCGCKKGTLGMKFPNRRTQI